MKKKESASRYKNPVAGKQSVSYGIFSENSAPNIDAEVQLFSQGASVRKEKKMLTANPSRNTFFLGYTPAHLAVGKRWYIEFTAFDPETEKMKRKRVSVPPVRPLAAKRRYANDMLLDINMRLSNGWNPFVSLNAPAQYVLFDDVCGEYARYLEKLLESGMLRKKSYDGYKSYLKKLREYNSALEKPATYLFQFKSDYISKFLDKLWLDDGKTVRTRDNYLGWLRTFCEWLLSKSYISEDPTANLVKIQGKRKVQKNRSVIPQDELKKMKTYLEQNDRHFLLACNILYYCFIRPKEMSYIKIGDIHVKEGIITMSGGITKNGKDSAVTLPDCVVKLMLDLNVFSHSSDEYLFSRNCQPGKHYVLPIRFCEYWDEMRAALKWPDTYKFYSLKDTGITDLIKDHADLLSVRDQARHHSLEMTDIYTPMSSASADESIRHRTGAL